MGWGRVALAIAVPSARPCAARGHTHTFQADRLPDLTGPKGSPSAPSSRTYAPPLKALLRGCRGAV